jgi:HSP20 family protein
MSLVRFDPLRDLAILQDRVNRAFGEVARRNGDDDLLAGGPWVPPVDIYENDSKAIVLKAEIPDVNREDISLKVENNTLTLSGRKQAEKDIKEQQYHRVERTFGSFSRTFTLPATVDTARIAAEYKNGVLSVTLPLREDAKPKQIEVAVH